MLRVAAYDDQRLDAEEGTSGKRSTKLVLLSRELRLTFRDGSCHANHPPSARESRLRRLRRGVHRYQYIWTEKSVGEVGEALAAQVYRLATHE